jgi:hypothetical protein
MLRLAGMASPAGRFAREVMAAFVRAGSDLDRPPEEGVQRCTVLLDATTSLDVVTVRGEAPATHALIGGLGDSITLRGNFGTVRVRLHRGPDAVDACGPSRRRAD